MNTQALILSVDDEQDILDLISRWLGQEGFTVVTVQKPAEIPGALDGRIPDLILLDVMMPGTDGYAFCAKLQKSPDVSAIPVVFLTALSTEADKTKAFSVGAAGFLSKPIQKKTLVEEVRRHLETSRRWKRLEQAPQASPGPRPTPEFSSFREYLAPHLKLDPPAAGALKALTPSNLYSSCQVLGLSPEGMASHVAQFLGLACFPHINPELVELGVLPSAFCRHNKVLPIQEGPGGGAFVLSNPFNAELLAVLKQQSGAQGRLRLIVAPEARIAELLSPAAREEPAPPLTQPVVEEMPIPRVAAALLSAAVNDRASDVHIEPKGEKVVVRFRVDGDLREAFSLGQETGSQLITCFKAEGDMDVAERRRPQDGVLQTVIGKRSFIVRLATTSTPDGESMILRLLEPWAKPKSLGELGMTDAQVEHMRGFAMRNQGLLLVAGPTGAGKTTTIFSLLQHIDCSRRSLITIEDPVEYRIPAANQQQVAEKAGITFESLLKSAVRQDPDILFLGEMRDPFSAKMAIDFASTGHLTISTVHTANSTTAIFRLERIGISRGAMADCILGVVAQKLVKRLCPHCKEVGETSPEEAEMLRPFTDDVPKKVARPVGCDKCGRSGFHGREGIYEIVKFYPQISEMIRQGAPISEIRDFAAGRGDYLISRHAIEKVRGLVFDPKEVYEAVLLEEAEYRRKTPAKRSGAAAAPEPTAVVSPPGGPGAGPPAAAAPEPEEELIGAGEAPGARGAAPAGGGARAQILVVDDTEDTRSLIERVLGNQGYEVCAAADGVEALALLGRREFDLILSDVEMPNLDGFRLLEMIAQKGIKTPVIFLTARGGGDWETHGLDLGAEDYIAKPVRKTVLLSRIKRALERRPRSGS